MHYNWHRYYDPSLGRYITRDPIGLEGELNTYGYVDANPLRYIDLMGLSEQDVQNIIDKYNETVIYMTENNIRHPNPYWNNLSSTLGSSYIGCDDQAYVVQSSFDIMPTDDDGTYDIVPGNTWTTLCASNYCTHWQLQATSSNQNDPVIYMDPWYGNEPVLVKD